MGEREGRESGIEGSRACVIKIKGEIQALIFKHEYGRQTIETLPVRVGFLLLRAAPVAYGGSQARGLIIAVAASLR